MSQKNILKALTELGLKKSEAKIYFYLSKRGPKQANEITKALKMNKQQLYPSIKNLQNRGIVETSLDYPAKFSAVPFDKVLDLFAKTRFEEAKMIQQNKEKILSDWESINLTPLKRTPIFFNVLKGRNIVYAKIQQMIQETTNQFSVIMDISDLYRLEQFGILDIIKTHPKNLTVKFRIITEVPKHHLQIARNLADITSPNIKLRVRNTDYGPTILPVMVIRDKKEILYFVSQRAKELGKQSEYDSLFTNCTSIISPLSSVFEELWHDSTDIEQKICEIKTGISPQKTLIIKNIERAQTKYNETLKQARNEVIMITSSDELFAYWKNPSLLQKLAEQGASIKIMAPISRKYLKASLFLSEFCEVRHVSNEYIKTVIVDGMSLFQFKSANSNCRNETDNSIAFYSNDLEYVEKTRKLLLDIWSYSVDPSSITAEIVVQNRASNLEAEIKKNSKYKFIDVVYTTTQLNDKTESSFTEQQVTTKIAVYKKNTRLSNPKIVTAVGSEGHAIIRSGKIFDFPDLLINSYKFHEESTFGAEDALQISIWHNTDKGYRYVPAAIVGTNPEAAKHWKQLFKNKFVPIEEYYQLFRRDELKIQVHGTTLFVGWTKPIKVLYEHKSLPPSAMLLEATGKMGTRAFDITLPNGIRDDNVFNYYDAFPTVFYKKSKYQGPATDGLLVTKTYHEQFLP